MSSVPPTLHSIRGIMGCCHILENGHESVMIDAGMIGEPFFIRRKIKQLGLKPESVKVILLTHGHLDHAGNLAWLKEWTGARVFAHPSEQSHVNGEFPYTGINLWCGRLEAAGRFLFRYRKATIDQSIADGDELPFWGGLRVVHLPGHTQGHCGFFSTKHSLLFCGDMMASYFFNAHKPWAILNSCPENFPSSVDKIRKLAPRLIVPCHYDFLDGELHRKRFCRLYRIADWITSSTAAESARNT
jgi:glyoxylase-like metal-dependent hydrolase (beta-lactamase superfamily II)